MPPINWEDEANYSNWELRKHRFTPEMRPVLYGYLGIGPESRILDVGCGTGVFARFLAEGLTMGKAVGVDISPHLVAYGNRMAESEGLGDKAELLRGNGYSLPFDGDAFDAVTGHTYLGVLTDPKAGLLEMARVCRPGGVVSSVCSVISETELSWAGDEPWEHEDRLNELHRKQERIYQSLLTPRLGVGNAEWPVRRFPKLFTCCGLREVHLYTFAFCFSNSDSRWPLEYRRNKTEEGMSDYGRMIRERSELPEMSEGGMTSAEFREMLDLISRKQAYLTADLEDDRRWQWSAGLATVVAGRKQSVHAPAEEVPDLA